MKICEDPEALSFYFYIYMCTYFRDTSPIAVINIYIGECSMFYETTNNVLPLIPPISPQGSLKRTFALHQANQRPLTVIK